MNSDILGFVAGILTTSCFIPQAIKIVKNKSANGVSLLMYIMFSCGVSAWLVYGILIKNLPIIVFNSITLVLCFLIVFNLIKYKNK